MDEIKNIPANENQAITLLTFQKKSYHKPQFTTFGDIRDLTLAPSPGYYESGRAVNQRARFRQP